MSHPLFHPLSPDSAFRGLARAVLQVALTGSRHIVAGLVTIVAGILAVAAGLLRVALGIPAALITAVARFAVAASKSLVETLVRLSTALSRLSRALAPEIIRVSAAPSQTAVPGTDLLPAKTSGRAAQGDEGSRTESAPSEPSYPGGAPSGLDIAQPNAAKRGKRGKKRSKMRRVPPERTVPAAAPPATTGEPTPPTATTDSSPKRLAPGWGWWAVGGICTIAVAWGFCTVQGFTLATSLFLCGPLLIGCVWMMPACLRPYNDARRHLRQDVVASTVLALSMTQLSSTDSVIEQIVFNDSVSATLLGFLVLYPWLGLIKALLSLNHEYWQRRRGDTDPYGTGTPAE
ncbi:hypothetical protein D5R93_12495 [Actinomyces lilanjuaniae]|uniref:Uncharacterized protein n=1 Tax=Actinomyces lilanjuaniae TaxID=2321394 RepID=A0ABN5PQN3_9ACTO|nr:hypothetical protein [Actinomyces lilanjuaniae]AYD90614.1 hypothetical protein D5R93_12495 [Actinomyces lilanjuaniae]